MVQESNVNSIDKYTEFLSQNYKKKRLFAHDYGFLQQLGMCQMSGTGSPIKQPKTKVKKAKSIGTFDKFFEIPKEDNCRAVFVAENELLVKTGVDKMTLHGKAMLIQKDSADPLDIFNDVAAAHFWCLPEQKVFAASSF